MIVFSECHQTFLFCLFIFQSTDNISGYGGIFPLHYLLINDTIDFSHEQIKDCYTHKGQEWGRQSLV